MLHLFVFLLIYHIDIETKSPVQIHLHLQVLVWSQSCVFYPWLLLMNTYIATWMLLPSRFRNVRLCATLWTVAHQAPLSLGFSRQEHWSGLPFPSPMHESEVKLLSHVWRLATPWTAGFQAPPSMGFSRQEYWSGVPLHWDTEVPLFVEKLMIVNYF